MQRFDVICKEAIDILMDIFMQRFATIRMVWERFLIMLLVEVMKRGRYISVRFLILARNVAWEGNYSGAPLKTHLDLPPFPREYFEIWLELFDESLREIFNDTIAEQILGRAQMIAQRFKFMLYESKH